MNIYATGPASTDTVWQRYSTPSQWASWARQIRAVEYPGTVLTPGGSGIVHGPFPIRLRFTVDRVDGDARRWSWIIRLPGHDVFMEHGVDAYGSGSRAWASIMVPGWLGMTYRPMAAHALRRLVQE